MVATIAANDSVTNTYAYLPYGDTPSGSLSGTAFGYAGYRWDAETGTYHTATRSYDPRLGRFLQTDPIGQDGGINIYAYAGGDPLNGTDTSGLYAGPFGGSEGSGPENGTQGSEGVGGETASGSGSADHSMTFGGLSLADQRWSGSGTSPSNWTRISYNSAVFGITTAQMQGAVDQFNATQLVQAATYSAATPVPVP